MGKREGKSYKHLLKGKEEKVLTLTCYLEKKKRPDLVPSSQKKGGKEKGVYHLMPKKEGEEKKEKGLVLALLE